MGMEISYVYYREIFNSIKKEKKSATKKDVIDYLNKSAGILGGVKFIKII